jgi:hypothetical protein
VKLLGHKALRIVVARDDHERNVGTAQTACLADHEQGGVVIPPGSVEEVAGDNHERHFFAERKVDQVRERTPRRTANVLDRRAGIARQPNEGCVEVDIGSVKELEVRHAADSRERGGRIGSDRAVLAGPAGGASR